MQKKIELIICQGLPGSGKSTWSKQWVEDFPKTRIRVNRDDIRRLLGPYWVPSREKLVTKIEYDIVYEALLNGYSVVSDNTNLRSNNPYSSFVNKNTFPNVDIHVKSFLDVSIEECIERDLNRFGNERVGEEVIRRMFKTKKV